MRQISTLILVVMGFVALATGCAQGSSASQTIESGGVTRSYLLYQPANLPSGEVPLVIGLHGAGPGGGPLPFENGNGFDQLADQDGFIVAYPAALGTTPSTGALWHMGCCDATQNSSDDVEFINALIDHLVATANVDSRRVYVIGFSVGAAMAYRMGCESDKVAGVGSVGGWERLSVACHPSHPVSVYEIHGTADSYNGSCGEGTTSNEDCLDGFGTPGYSPSVHQVNEQWRAADQCPATATTQVLGAVTRETWEPCGGSSGVRLDTIQNGGHCWPTQTTCGNFSGSAALWDFLSAHPLSFRPGEGEGPGEEEPGEEEPGEEEVPPGEEEPGEEEAPGEEVPPAEEEVPPGEEVHGEQPKRGDGGPPGASAVTTGAHSPTSSGRQSHLTCTVPKLRGLHLGAARRVARRAGCVIGPVHRRMRSKRAGGLIVRWQSLRTGSVHKAHTKIAVGVRRARGH